MVTKNQKLQPFLSASLTPACPGTVPVSCPSVPAAGRSVACPEVVCCHPFMQCAHSAHISAKEFKLGTPTVSDMSSGFQNKVPVRLVHPSVLSHRGLYCYSLTCSVTSGAGRLIFIWL